MSNIVKKTISLTKEQAAFIEAQVASGQYANASEVIRESLRREQRHAAALEKFIREEGAKAYDDYMAHPERALPIDEAFAKIYADIEALESAPEQAAE
ncbi:MAG: type II toxin-antitoxin system ParD family antitoxin [Asticcacaulis sp.]|jgi:antitoxin ParD1/3/4|uniref:type II toxin-antitoxin system ParD family antitoxin n=1 Tax=Asticcacaulis sp. TaxID=1872648 RepID=UPI003F7B779E